MYWFAVWKPLFASIKRLFNPSMKISTPHFLQMLLDVAALEDGRLAIEAIRQLDCQTLPSETVFYSLLGSATHPNFRSLSKLVATYSNSSISTQKILSEKPDTARIRFQSSQAELQKVLEKKQKGRRAKLPRARRHPPRQRRKLAKNELRNQAKGKKLRVRENQPKRRRLRKIT